MKKKYKAKKKMKKGGKVGKMTGTTMTHSKLGGSKKMKY